jgi:hypothetical protein
MELRDDKLYEGRVYLQPEQFTRYTTRYPWEYWIGLSLWTGQWIYLKNGVDFSVGAKSFRVAVHDMSAKRKVNYSASWRDLPNDEIKVIWYLDEPRAFLQVDEDDVGLRGLDEWEMPDFLKP